MARQSSRSRARAMSQGRQAMNRMGRERARHGGKLPEAPPPPQPRPEPPPKPSTISELQGVCSATAAEAEKDYCYGERNLECCLKCNRVLCYNCIQQHTCQS